MKKILENYDKNFRPQTGGSTVVRVNTFVRKLSNICSNNQEYTVQMTFRLLWNDPRLSFQTESNSTYILITDQSLIWIPGMNLIVI